MHDAPQCLACGACCFSTLDTYVRVSGDDHARLGDEGQHLCHFIEHRCYMRLEDGHCAALRCDVAGSFFCSVYEHRPEVCRGLERGSSACQAERITKAERPLLALGRLRSSV